MRRLDSNMLLFSFVSSIFFCLYFTSHLHLWLPCLSLAYLSCLLPRRPPHPCSHCNVIPSSMISCYLFEGSVLFPKRRNGSST
ncbi:hypothetical protein CKAH01_12395 [Colletotrichum kahawae]|uniref:Uncharacterized protein n=1 Tax=Colletotrichum kahawae TaxID=34407 RepID=A0AAE0DCT4_COLKA|nr:hypothetical protein CKAH01_12395 [Colletotrichum kahawae]